MRTVVPAPGMGQGVGYGLGLIRLPLSCGGQIWAHGGDLAGGGVANVSGQDDSGRSATVYITALTGGAGVEHLRRTMDVALCS
ncbi:hypothetical protein [Amycolatopsis magusensis]|uniref:hypothetical protein n=1 Tax=Amycolatopsis magusensis TaxID=882444 RepID=UPI00378B1A1A